MTAIEPEFIEGVYRDIVGPAQFDGVRSSSNPVLLLVGAQPGAGKTRAMRMAMAEYAPEAVVVSGDNFRRYHPNYEQYRAERPQDMPTSPARFLGRSSNALSRQRSPTATASRWKERSATLMSWQAPPRVSKQRVSQCVLPC